jgi:hypothetical protein
MSFLFPQSREAAFFGPIGPVGNRRARQGPGGSSHLRRRSGGLEDRQGAEFIYCLAALRACAAAP